MEPYLIQGVRALEHQNAPITIVTETRYNPQSYDSSLLSPDSRFDVLYPGYNRITLDENDINLPLRIINRLVVFDSARMEVLSAERIPAKAEEQPMDAFARVIKCKTLEERPRSFCIIIMHIGPDVSAAQTAVLKERLQEVKQRLHTTNECIYNCGYLRAVAPYNSILLQSLENVDFEEAIGEYPNKGLRFSHIWPETTEQTYHSEFLTDTFSYDGFHPVTLNEALPDKRHKSK